MGAAEVRRDRRRRYGGLRPQPASLNRTAALLSPGQGGRRHLCCYRRDKAIQEVPKSVTDEYLKNNEAYASTFTGPLPLPPSKHVAVVACMDARLDVYRVLGLADGEAHVIRNAGGVITDDEIRSLSISQRLLGTTEIILIHHTDCGMLTFTDDGFKQQIQDEIGIKPEWAAESFIDIAEDVRQSIRRIEASPFVTKHESLRGFVFDVATGKLNEVV